MTAEQLDEIFDKGEEDILLYLVTNRAVGRHST
jgi:hypothetical protein